MKIIISLNFSEHECASSTQRIPRWLMDSSRGPSCEVTRGHACQCMGPLMYSSFLLQSKDVHLRVTGDCKSGIHENMSMNGHLSLS